MKITDYPKATSIKPNNVFLIDGPDGTKRISASDLGFPEDGAALMGQGDISNPNLLINGDFSVAQRGASFPNAANNTYTLDRWKPVNTYGNITKVSNGVSLKKRSVADYASIGQNVNVDELNLRGKLLTFTVNIKAINNMAPNYPVMRIAQNTGNADVSLVLATQLDLVVGNNSLTIEVPLTGPSYLMCYIYFAPNTHIDQEVIISHCKLEIGDKATLFVPRLPGEELSLCQRYFERVGRIGTPLLSAVSFLYPGTDTVLFFVPYARKRIVPTVALRPISQYRLMALSNTNNGVAFPSTFSSLAVSYSETTACTVLGTIPSAPGIGYHVVLQRGDQSTEPWIDVDAEVY